MKTKNLYRLDENTYLKLEYESGMDCLHINLQSYDIILKDVVIVHNFTTNDACLQISNPISFNLVSDLLNYIPKWMSECILENKKI